MSGSIYYPGVNIMALGTLAEASAGDFFLILHYDSTQSPPQYVPKRITPFYNTGTGAVVGSTSTSGSTAGYVNNLPPTPSQTCTYRITGQINGQSLTTGDTISFDVSALFKQFGTGSLVIAGGYNASQFYSDASVSSSNVSISVVSNAPSIQLNGVSGLNMDWNWTLTTVVGT